MHICNTRHWSIKSLIIFYIIIFLGGCSDHNMANPVSMVQILSDPSKWDGKLVATQGFLLFDSKIKFGRIYFSKEDAEFYIEDRAIPVDLRGYAISDEELKDIQAKYVIIIGKFEKGYPIGHLNNIQKIIVLRRMSVDDCRFRYSPGYNEPYPCWAEQSDQ